MAFQAKNQAKIILLNCHPGQRREKPPRQQPLDEAPATPRAGNSDPGEEEGPAHFGETAGQVSRQQCLPDLGSVSYGLKISRVRFPWLCTS